MLKPAKNWVFPMIFWFAEFQLPFGEPKNCPTELIFCRFPIHTNWNDNPDDLWIL